MFDHFERGENATTKESSLLLINGANSYGGRGDPLTRHLALLPFGVVGGIGEEGEDIIRRTFDLPGRGQPHELVDHCRIGLAGLRHDHEVV